MARILMLTQPTDGGVFQHVARLCEGLATRGHEPVVAAPLDGRQPGLEAEIVPLEMVRAVTPGADARAVAAAARVVRRVRPALVHAHSSKAAAVERALAPLASLVLCVCEAERRLAASVGPARRTRVVHNGVPDPEPAPVHPHVAQLRERGPVVGMVTLLRPGKGLETVVDAMPELLAAHPTVSVAVAGGGPDREQIEARARKRGVSGALHLIGETAGPMPLLAGADVFLSASWAESFPYNVLEAMAAGLPVVATDVGGTAEAVAVGVTGLVVPPRDPGALASVLADLLADPERRARLGEAGRRRVAERFTVEGMLDGTAAVYQELGALP